MIWKNNGTFMRINLALNHLESFLLGRSQEPSLALADSQSVLLNPMIAQSRGLDGNP